MSSPQSVPPVPFTAKSLYNFVGNHEDELQFKKGDFITVLQVVEGGWWEGQLQVPGIEQGTGPIGWFPANHIKIVSDKIPPQVVTTTHSISTNATSMSKDKTETAQFQNPTQLALPTKSSDNNSSVSTTAAKPAQKVSHYSLVDTGVYSLLETQLSFEATLSSLLEKSLIPLGNNNILSAKDYDILCCNLHEVTQLVKSLTKELTEICKAACNQQKCGKQMYTFLSRYRTLMLIYCANHPSAVRVISNHSSQLDNFAKASRSSIGGVASPGASSTGSPSNVLSSSANPNFTGNILDLTAAFSQPFRQIETYSAVLREIKASISDSHPDYINLTEAIRMADNLVNELDELRTIKDKEIEILTNSRIEGWPLVGELAHISALGNVIQISLIYIQQVNQVFTECYMLMFRDYIVILEQSSFDARNFKCHHVIPMHGLVAHAKDYTSNANSSEQQSASVGRFPLVLIDHNGERYQVYLKLNQLRSHWVKSIGEQSVQSQSRTLTSSSHTHSSSATCTSNFAPDSVNTNPTNMSPSHLPNHSNMFHGSNRARASAAATMTHQTVNQNQMASSRHVPPPFMRNEKVNTQGHGHGLSSGGHSAASSQLRSTAKSAAVTTGGFDITQLRPNPPMTPSELILLCSKHSSDSVKSPKVSRKKSNRKSEKIRAEELAEMHNRKTLDCRSLDHDAKIFEVIEAYCQSSQNRMTLHSAIDVMKTTRSNTNSSTESSNSSRSRVISFLSSSSSVLHSTASSQFDDNTLTENNAHNNSTNQPSNYYIISQLNGSFPDFTSIPSWRASTPAYTSSPQKTSPLITRRQSSKKSANSNESATGGNACVNQRTVLLSTGKEPLIKQALTPVTVTALTVALGAQKSLLQTNNANARFQPRNRTQKLAVQKSKVGSRLRPSWSFCHKNNSAIENPKRSAKNSNKSHESFVVCEHDIAWLQQTNQSQVTFNASDDDDNNNNNNTNSDISDCTNKDSNLFSQPNAVKLKQPAFFSIERKSSADCCLSATKTDTADKGTRRPLSSVQSSPQLFSHAYSNSAYVIL